MGPRLLAPRARWVGAALLGLGVGLAFVRFGLGVRPAWLELPAFAVYSAYFEVKAFTVFSKNLTDELILLLSLGGLWVLAFSAEPREDAAVAHERAAAWALALRLQLLFLGLAVVTVFGLGFVYVLVANLYAPVVLFLVLFRWRRWRVAARAEVTAC